MSKGSELVDAYDRAIDASVWCESCEQEWANESLKKARAALVSAIDGDGHSCDDCADADDGAECENCARFQYHVDFWTPKEAGNGES